MTTDQRDAPPTTNVRDTRKSAVLAVEGLCKSFHDQQVLFDVDLEVRPGEVHALLGANGSGKSTVIKIVAGFHRADAGRVQVDDVDVTGHSPAEMARRGVRFVHQNGGLVAPLTVAENLMLGNDPICTRWRTVDRDAEREAVRELLGRLNIELDPDRPVATLRAVEQSAIAIGRALAHPDELRLLVLDEPTAALPATEVALLFDLIRQVVSSGASVLYVTHRLDEVLLHAHRATVLRDGCRVATRDVSELDESSLARLIVGPDVTADASAHVAGPRSSRTVGSSRATSADVAEAAGSAAAPSRPALEVVGLRSQLLDGVSLTVAPGEILGLAGLNGSGRDEIPRVLCGMAGTFDSLRIGDHQPVRSIDPQQAVKLGLALVPGNRQPGSAVFEFSLQENLGITSQHRHRRRGLLDVARERVLTEQWIERLAIRPPDPEKAFNELSGGNQQKVILAKWLAVNPSVVILDEPTAGVDVGARQSIYDVVRRSAAEGLAFIVCSSDNQDLVHMADRVLLVSDGRIVDELRRPDITGHEIASRLAAASNKRRVPA